MSSTPISGSTTHLEDRTVLGADLSVMEMSQHPWVGPAQTNPPNRLLYLGLERPLHYNDPDICFVGRVDGNVIGSVSVLDVLCGIARNFSQPQECCHDEISIDVVNTHRSTWINKKKQHTCRYCGNPSSSSCKRRSILGSFCYRAVRQASKLYSTRMCQLCSLHCNSI